jgi:hypothetical protein
MSLMRCPSGPVNFKHILQHIVNAVKEQWTELTHYGMILSRKTSFYPQHQTGYETHPASLPMDTGGLFHGVYGGHSKMMTVHLHLVLSYKSVEPCGHSPYTFVEAMYH